MASYTASKVGEPVHAVQAHELKHMNQRFNPKNDMMYCIPLGTGTGDDDDLLIPGKVRPGPHRLSLQEWVFSVKWYLGLGRWRQGRVLLIGRQTWHNHVNHGHIMAWPFNNVGVTQASHV